MNKQRLEKPEKDLSAYEGLISKGDGHLKHEVSHPKEEVRCLKEELGSPQVSVLRCQCMGCSWTEFYGMVEESKEADAVKVRMYSTNLVLDCLKKLSATRGGSSTQLGNKGQDNTRWVRMANEMKPGHKIIEQETGLNTKFMLILKMFPLVSTIN